MLGMHWDGAVSIGNILSFIGIIGIILGALHRFTIRYERHSVGVTDAVNNLSSITDGLQKSVTIQNGRLAKVETAMAIHEEVERRMVGFRNGT